jgi:protein-S-isoprenylcysteine O-methyltransferase Ste14
MKLLRLVLGVTASLLCVLALFGVAGRWDWLRGWVYVALLALGPSLSGLLVWRKDPELLRRRASAGEGTPRWDKVVLGLFGLTWVLVPLTAAYEVRRGGVVSGVGSRGLGGDWVAGLLLFALGTILVTAAMLANTHFEKTVRIQKDRDHRVVEGGPYAVVRHPGYVGALLAWPLAAPLLLGSSWAWIPAIASASTLVLRTGLEDRLLRRELPGYEAYAHRVRYRLIPGLW